MLTSVKRLKMAMSDAQLMHASRMARGEEAYQGKLLEARQVRLQGRGRFAILKFAHRNSGLGSLVSGRSGGYGQDKTVL